MIASNLVATAYPAQTARRSRLSSSLPAPGLADIIAITTEPYLSVRGVSTELAVLPPLILQVALVRLAGGFVRLGAPGPIHQTQRPSPTVGGIGIGPTRTADRSPPPRCPRGRLTRREFSRVKKHGRPTPIPCRQERGTPRRSRGVPRGALPCLALRQRALSRR